ncbi:hypothetical protein [Brevibacterium salitolerans]|uniref:Uncharacterized protein n=1 Tax=Brevibacterium salitolerans TaxID=1403566 RepID=A0ABP5I056_9MICO
MTGTPRAADTPPNAGTEGPPETQAPAEQGQAETPGTTQSAHEHDDALADEWGEESFPSSDPPGHY